MRFSTVLVRGGIEEGQLKESRMSIARKWAVALIMLNDCMRNVAVYTSSIVRSIAWEERFH